MFNSEAKQLILKKKSVLALCQQAESKVEQLKSLQPDSEEGFIAVIEHNKIQVQLHFTPEKITLSEDSIEGELRLLKAPQFQTDSIVYRYLIAGWNMFLGGKIPNGALPNGVRVENNKVYYTLPRNQAQLVDGLFHNLKNGSALITNVKQGDLIIESSVSLSWNDFKLQNLLQLFNSKKDKNKDGAVV
ncbi:hypothetical protein DSM106972_001960 [Dulcicalothrix desertica PCC 7102]|uniref:Uncharacterized protein n=1 Tax=Dulcicalothrix desertica PCC 7102 TaxID=232991 RepID=A0A3S1CVN4_9CYAN|nr:hypothetical protein [Dulcicalothrix desertica]RUT09701.1 hypothetical protein DSM106972_001960 [Dulcicalothrix desertica PCC 7102]TWH50899.1 hypothetical protein CAL7102_05247 [Dulcicalothrix desertica PCC 7102]